MLAKGIHSISDSGKIDIFLKKKSEQLPKKKKLMSKSKVAERKELLNHLRLVAKLETEVNCNKNMGWCSFGQESNSNATKLKKWIKPNLVSQ